eukprot:jgi/Tetstr1/445605/TSEL_003411.t1
MVGVAVVKVKEESILGQCRKLKVVKGTVYFDTGLVAAKEDTDQKFPTGYSVDPSDPKAWPSSLSLMIPKHTQFASCMHIMHMVGPTDDNDAQRYVLGWNCSASIPPPLPTHMGGFVFRWEPPGQSEADKLERETFGTLR